MVDQREALLTATRQAELVLDPVRGEFDIAHLREVHRRIFQDLPHHGPGEFRPEAPGHFKHRVLEDSRTTVLVPYALRSETDRMLGPTLEALKGGAALQGFDLLEMSEAVAQTYARLDYLHPFREGNSRTLRTFTEQLARENGYRLDWGTTNANATTRDQLYLARDLAVIQIRNPGLTMADALEATTREDYEVKYQLASQLEHYRLADPLQELVRRSLERGRDPASYDRRMTVAETAREIVAVQPIAANQAERAAEENRIAVLRRTAPASSHDLATSVRDWAARDGTVTALTDRLADVAGGDITIRHDPGAPALDRLRAISEGIERELTTQRTVAAPALGSTARTIDPGDIER